MCLSARQKAVKIIETSMDPKKLRLVRFEIIISMVVEDPILEEQVRFYLDVAKKAQGEP